MHPMPQKKQPKFVLTPAQMRGLEALARFRIMTIDQFAWASGLKKTGASEALRKLYGNGLLSSGGHVPHATGRTPKIYWINKKGFDYFQEYESPEDGTGLNFGKRSFSPIHLRSAWPQSMPHRLATVDAVLGITFALGRLEHRVTRCKLDYMKEERFGKTRKATTDFVSDDLDEHNKIVPDAVMAVANPQGQFGLLFVEADRGTENIRVGNFDPDQTVEGKLRKYDRYFLSGRFQQTYAKWSEDIRGCACLFVTTQQRRIDTIRKLGDKFERKLHPAFLFTTFEKLLDKDIGQKVWQNRNPSDERLLTALGGS